MSIVTPSPTPLPGLHLRGLGRPLPISQIVRFEADDNYTRIYVRGQVHPLLYAYTLGVMCQRFPFMARITRSAAINPQHVQAVTQQGLELRNHPPVWLSRHYLKRLPAELSRARQVVDRQVCSEP
ncbi:LytTR family DNA-binding domain-containing protein [Fibrella forsythiae]|uniref:LytTR family transcriptional regulator n=1 Tax=Fibrella forsythiae TaxID=2817061 RepID=A0ABS3JS90_9BACT|nr:LytTR family DNA-binding domain-containing protein [Fibrella forsythiae]MBO0952871.1 LytTR family transcriptional regulator [Fibrella forsythiae]